MKTIVFDFDGVIHKGYNGWRDGSIYGTIDTELLDYMQYLMNDYYVVISSNRPAQQIVDCLNKLEYPAELFIKTEEHMYWDTPCVFGVTNAKPVGVLYIDDRGFRYNPNHSTKRSIREISKMIKKIEK